MLLRKRPKQRVKNNLKNWRLTTKTKRTIKIMENTSEGFEVEMQFVKCACISFNFLETFHISKDVFKIFLFS